MKDGIRLWQEAAFPLLYVSQRILRHASEGVVSSLMRSMRSKLSEEIAGILSDGRPYVVRMLPLDHYMIPDHYGPTLDQYTFSAFVALQYAVDAKIGEWVAHNDTGEEVVHGRRSSLLLGGECRTFELTIHRVKSGSLFAWKRIG